MKHHQPNRALLQSWFFLLVCFVPFAYQRHLQRGSHLYLLILIYLDMTSVSLGAGCYWGTEKFVRKDFQKRFPGSIVNGKVGFMSPHENHLPNPSYRRVCNGDTGHVEVFNVELSNPSHFEDLIKFFFLFHDPTTKDRQGNDQGTQYASAIFVSNEEQKRMAHKVIRELQDAIDSGKISPYSGKKIVTKIHMATRFYAAEDYHQEYLSKNPDGYCNHYLRMTEWPLN